MTSPSKAAFRAVLIGCLLAAPSYAAASDKTDKASKRVKLLKSAPKARSPANSPVAVKGGSMVEIPGGKFKMGSDSDQAMANERPVHEVTVATFQLDVTPVTVAAFRECVNASACEEPLGRGFGGGSGYSGCNWEATDGSKEKYPVNCLTFADAQAFCTWAGKRLPTEEEWEYAAKGGSENRKYPWGGEDPWKDAPNDPAGHGIPGPHGCWGARSTCEVGSYTAPWLGKWGLQDMVGNINQWTSGGDSLSYDQPRWDGRHILRGVRVPMWNPGVTVLRTTFRITHGFDDAKPPPGQNMPPMPPGGRAAGSGPFNTTETGVRCAK